MSFLWSSGECTPAPYGLIWIEVECGHKCVFSHSLRVHEYVHAATRIISTFQASFPIYYKRMSVCCSATTQLTAHDIPKPFCFFSPLASDAERLTTAFEVEAFIAGPPSDRCDSVQPSISRDSCVYPGSTRVRVFTSHCAHASFPPL